MDILKILLKWSIPFWNFLWPVPHSFITYPMDWFLRSNLYVPSTWLWTTGSYSEPVTPRLLPVKALRAHWWWLAPKQFLCTVVSPASWLPLTSFQIWVRDFHDPKSFTSRVGGEWKEQGYLYTESSGYEPSFVWPQECYLTSPSLSSHICQLACAGQGYFRDYK